MIHEINKERWSIDAGDPYTQTHRIRVDYPDGTYKEWFWDRKTLEEFHWLVGRYLTA